MTTGLIIGYGRAGKRHGKLLDELRIKWVFFDEAISLADVLTGKQSARKAWFRDLDELLEQSSKDYDFAVICTPPDLHLAQIRQCLDADLPVLCEKPLCGLGQLAEAEALLQHPNVGKVMIGFNWRYHPKLKELRQTCSHFFLGCVQHRELPEWGLLLDHGSHDLDIASFICGPGLEVKKARHTKSDNSELWFIETSRGVIWEQVTQHPCERRADLQYDNDYLALDPDPAMYTAMWEAFLSGKYEPGLEEAIKTQQLLERCAELAR